MVCLDLGSRRRSRVSCSLQHTARNAARGSRRDNYFSHRAIHSMTSRETPPPLARDSIDRLPSSARRPARTRLKSAFTHGDHITLLASLDASAAAALPFAIIVGLCVRRRRSFPAVGWRMVRHCHGSSRLTGYDGRAGDRCRSRTGNRIVAADRTSRIFRTGWLVIHRHPSVGMKDRASLVASVEAIPSEVVLTVCSDPSIQRKRPTGTTSVQLRKNGAACLVADQSKSISNHAKGAARMNCKISACIRRRRFWRRRAGGDDRRAAVAVASERVLAGRNVFRNGERSPKDYRCRISAPSPAHGSANARTPCKCGTNGSTASNGVG